MGNAPQDEYTHGYSPVSPPGDDWVSGPSWRRREAWRRRERMDEGFPGGRRGVTGCTVLRAPAILASHWPRHWSLNQWCAWSAVVPPRPISNRVVKRSSADGTGGLPAGRVGPCTQPSRRGAVAARRAHNPKVDGSNPSAATNAKASPFSMNGLVFCMLQPITAMPARGRRKNQYFIPTATI